MIKFALILAIVLSCKKKEEPTRLRRLDSAVNELAMKFGKLPTCIGETYFEVEKDGDGCTTNYPKGQFTCSVGERLFTCVGNNSIPCKEITAELQNHQ